MKNDQTFKFVAAILIAGVIIAFSTSPNHAAAPVPANTHPGAAETTSAPATE